MPSATPIRPTKNPDNGWLTEAEVKQAVEKAKLSQLTNVLDAASDKAFHNTRKKSDSRDPGFGMMNNPLHESTQASTLESGPSASTSSSKPSINVLGAASDKAFHNTAKKSGSDGPGFGMMSNSSRKSTQAPTLESEPSASASSSKPSINVLGAASDKAFHNTAKKSGSDGPGFGMMSNSSRKSTQAPTLESEPSASASSSKPSIIGRFIEAVSNFFSRITGNRAGSASITPTSSEPENTKTNPQSKTTAQDYRTMNRALGSTPATREKVKEYLQAAGEKKNPKSRVSRPRQATIEAEVRAFVEKRAPQQGTQQDPSPSTVTPQHDSPRPGRH